MNLFTYVSYLKTMLGILHGNRTYGGPFQVNLNLTDRCNIRCRHCYYYSPLLERPNLQSVRMARQTGQPAPDGDELRRSQQRDFDSVLLRSVIDDLLKMGTYRFQLIGRGEPLLHPDVLECAARVKYAGRYCFLVTNGTLLTQALVDEFITLGVNELRITTMAGTAEMYARTHPGVNTAIFPRLRQTLEYLAQQKQERRRRRPKVTLVCIVTRDNADQLWEFTEFACRVGVNGVLYHPIDDIEDSGLAALVPAETQAVSVRRELREIQHYLDGRGVWHNIPYFQRVFGVQLDTWPLYRRIPCYYGWLGTIIQPDGEVHACCRCYTVLGNLVETPFAHIWHGEAYRQFRHAALRLPQHQSPLPGCDYGSCTHHTANLRVFRILHPLQYQSVGHVGGNAI